MKNFGNKDNDLIRYDRLVQDALRGVVKRVIEEIANMGYLPSNHHFYITFATNAPGVKLSKVMKEKYKEEMTIIIQHQYWDLKTDNNGFSITLSFNATPEQIKIPYTAITGFYDPSVEFGLQFKEASNIENNSEENSENKNENKIVNIKEKLEANNIESDDNKVVSIDKFRKK